ncbi:MAG: hypothetical protein HQL56_18555, partial [Magnetococcales bacterium]|nr:hypothetical protein [Magnetococcales bacterium]
TSPNSLHLLSLPSLQEIAQIPLFTPAAGYGTTLDATLLLTNNSHQTLLPGQAHNPLPSYSNNLASGRFLFLLDTLNNRLLRLNLPALRPDRLSDIPHYSHLTALIAERMPFTRTLYTLGGEKHPTANPGLLTAIDAATLQPRWQVRLPAPLLQGDTSGLGRFAACLDQAAANRRSLILLDLEALDEAASHADLPRRDNIPFLEGRDDNSAWLRHIPLSGAPHRLSTSPDGFTALIDPSQGSQVLVMPWSRVERLFAGQIGPANLFSAQPRLGLGPLFSGFDADNRAFTASSLEKQWATWDMTSGSPLRHTPLPGPIVALTGNAHWLAVQTAPDLPPRPGWPRPTRLQLFSLQNPALPPREIYLPQPRDGLILHHSQLAPGPPLPREACFFSEIPSMAQQDGIRLGQDSRLVRTAEGARLYLVAEGSSFGQKEITLPLDAEVTLILTNREKGMSLHVALVGQPVQLEMAPSTTEAIRFRAGPRGEWELRGQWLCGAEVLTARCVLRVGS